LGDKQSTAAEARRIGACAVRAGGAADSTNIEPRRKARYARRARRSASRNTTVA
jgi:hypothetical protein